MGESWESGLHSEWEIPASMGKQRVLLEREWRLREGDPWKARRLEELPGKASRLEELRVFLRVAQEEGKKGRTGVFARGRKRGGGAEPREGEIEAF